MDGLPYVVVGRPLCFTPVSEVDIRFYFRGVRLRIFAVFGSDHHIFQLIDTQFPTELKLSNADFVLSDK